jgi:pantothenate kinase-related protein Tda10
MLAEALHKFYPAAVPDSLIWGYGQPLWDARCRVYGRKPLRVVVLGPAGSGKSTQCELLARR